MKENSKKLLKMPKKLFFPLLILFLTLIIIMLSQFLIKTVSNKSIIKDEKKHLNILLLGRGGGTHEGPDLTDTIMVVNVKPREKLVTFVSVPRDLWIPDLKNKINSAYAIGEESDKKGILLVKRVVEKITNQSIDYTIIGDFSGFVKFVDILGGIDVDVERAFDDYEYPIEEKKEDLCGQKEEEIDSLIASLSATLVFPCRYQYISFEKGLTHMDGKTALMFVRSRFAKGEEGTDFARSKRQQKVLSAIKEKTLSLGVILNPVKIYQIYKALQENIITDIKQEEIDDFITLSQNLKDAKIRNYILEEEEKDENKPGLLVNPTISDEYKYQWVLVPRKGNGDFSEIYKYVDCIFNSLNACPIKNE